ncbi:alpha/beta hydrolase [Parvularcula sp. ZS-1/3]|uniref:Alpha/beta hydrolase n=1 Tax=Parvularcula mediterranea TaxID=2732508 RepID=A0A7Y3RM01_9PROT|nr:alpha/beta hydrolase [Parvularcula mediterranea]NNU16435.1 alpha/beta hydrolase [Parvularcula mediterranea]
MRLVAALALGLSVLACADAPPAADAVAEPAPLMQWPDLTSGELPEPQATLRYREGDAGVVDVWVPDGEGPHPLVLMIHGGCWQKAIADRTLMNYAAEDLRQRGMAVWNIEYRGVDEAGGGYPGTFLDVTEAVDLISEAPTELNLDTSRVVAFGHSAGGHLAAWASARRNLPGGSALRREPHQPIAAVVVSGGLADLEMSEPVTLKSCLADVMELLTGPVTDERPDVLRETSLAGLLPPQAEQISVNATRDRIAPPLLGEAYTNAVLRAGGEARYVEVPGGHVELIAPGTEAWDVQAGLLMEALGL